MVYQIRVLSEIVIWFSGIFLVTFSLATHSLAQTNSQVAVDKLRALLDQQDAARSLQGDITETHRPDQSLWSNTRIVAYSSAVDAVASDPVGLLEIPSIDLLAPVFEGATDTNMNRGLGWIEGTTKPGDSGNLGIAGHRDGFFRPLKDLALEQLVILRTSYGEVKYRVKSLEIVEPDAVDVLDPTDENSLTLVTCYPFYYVGNAPQRFIVKAIEI